MNLIAKIAITTLLVPTLAFADYEAGRSAANRGDFSTARKEWEPLAAQGDKEAQFSLGRMYARGDGVRKDMEKAFALFKNSAELGHGRAALNLGIMYQLGDGVTKDLPRAKMWFKRARAAGIRESWDKLDKLSGVPDFVETTSQAVPTYSSTPPQEIVVTATPSATAIPVAAVTDTATQAPTLENNAGGSIVQTEDCSALDAEQSKGLTWILGLTPGDSIRDVYCKLTKASMVTKINGGSNDSTIKKPFDRSGSGVTQASLKLGTLKELITTGQNQPEDNLPTKISVTSPLVGVDLFEIGKISFKGTLWFDLAPNDKPLQKVASENGEVALASVLTKVHLSAKGNDVAIYGDEVIEQIKKQYSDAKISGGTPLSEAELNELNELDVKQLASDGLTPVEEKRYKELSERKSNSTDANKIVISLGHSQISISRLAGWIGIRFEKN